VFVKFQLNVAEEVTVQSHSVSQQVPAVDMLSVVLSSYQFLSCMDLDFVVNS
jgi:hypothetical protein